MFYGNEVQDTRKLFFSSWKKYRQKEPLSALESQLVRVILDHPEYHALLESATPFDNQPYFPELGQTNPFLHLGLHLAIRDQVTTDKPPGITAVYNALIQQQTALDAEHLLMERLAECLWSAQRQQVMPNEAAYLSACRELVRET
jgi:hypothetical protein